MSPQTVGGHSIWELIKAGGFSMYPLLLCSLIAWAVIFERLWRYRRLDQDLRSFHLEALNVLLRKEWDSLKGLISRYPDLPTSRLLASAMERLNSKDERLRERWEEALERRRQLLNQELRQNLWMLATIGSSAPFIGLFGTVVGILSSFQDMARSGAGGFNVVAAGISEALIATAAGIVVAVVSVIAYNAFQTRWSGLVLTIRLQTEEFAEVLSSDLEGNKPHGT